MGNALYLTRELAKLSTLEVIVNAKCKRRIDELRELATSMAPARPSGECAILSSWAGF